MSIDFESLLDQCLNQIESEEDIQACLREYPEQASELAPLLYAALTVRSLRELEPRSPAAAAAGRRRFLEEAAALRKEQERAPLRRLSAWWKSLGYFPTVMRRGLATSALVILLLMIVLGSGAWAVSARSLPGDPLYSFKLAGERVQLWLTFDEMAKAELQEEFESRRLEETKALIRERRTANVVFGGAVTRVSDTVWMVEGVTITLPIDVPAKDISEGAKVAVQGWTQPDGSVIVRKLEVQQASPTITPLPTSTAIAPVAETRPPLPTSTPMPTEVKPIYTSTPWPTKPPEPTDTLVPTSTTTPSPTETGTAEPTSTRTPTPSLTRTRTPTATPTRPRIIKLQFEGSISWIGPDSWKIGDEIVVINQATVIDKRAGAAEIGAWARVTAVRREDGSLLALEIVIERPAQRPPETTEFQGIIEAFSDAEWVISGITVQIRPNTSIEGTPVLGWLAWVRAVRYQGGPWIAVQIRVIQPEVVVQFEGTIESISASQWVVDGRIVLITGDTKIEGTPSVGLSAEIEAIQRPDGTLIARWIKVHNLSADSPPAIREAATPTATATSDPSLSVDSTPTLTALPQATPSPTAEDAIPPDPTVPAIPKATSPTPTPAHGHIT